MAGLHGWPAGQPRGMFLFLCSQLAGLAGLMNGYRQQFPFFDPPAAGCQLTGWLPGAVPF